VISPSLFFNYYPIFIIFIIIHFSLLDKSKFLFKIVQVQSWLFCATISVPNPAFTRLAFIRSNPSTSFCLFQQTPISNHHTINNTCSNQQRGAELVQTKDLQSISSTCVINQHQKQTSKPFTLQTPQNRSPIINRHHHQTVFEFQPSSHQIPQTQNP
jgi:hypothetical protein